VQGHFPVETAVGGQGAQVGCYTADYSEGGPAIEMMAGGRHAALGEFAGTDGGAEARNCVLIFH
jgi:hypothetical protein